MPTFSQIAFREAYLDGPDPALPVAFTLEIPPETERGDLLIIAEVTYPDNFSAPVGWTQFHLFNVSGQWARLGWYKIHDGDDYTPVPLIGSGASTNVYQRWFDASLSVFRPVEFTDPFEVVETGETTIGALDADAGIGVCWLRGVTSGVRNPWTDTPWTDEVYISRDGDYALTSMAVWQPGEPITMQDAPVFGNSFPLAYVVLGVNVIGEYVPTRLYPRDDGVGLSAAPRIYPPPRQSQRLVGGYQ